MGNAIVSPIIIDRYQLAGRVSAIITRLVVGRDSALSKMLLGSAAMYSISMDACITFSESPFLIGQPSS